VFHVELRQFPHVARAFNLTREQLDLRVLTRWVEGKAIEFDERTWSPERAKLTVYEARGLATEELGLGRGWSAVAGGGEDVTARVLQEARGRGSAPRSFKELLVEQLAHGAVGLSEIVELADAPSGRVSDRVAVAEQAVWELLHEGRLALSRDGHALGQGEWRAALLSWRAWTAGGLTVALADAS
jgi:hypothetical protein